MDRDAMEHDGSSDSSISEDEINMDMEPTRCLFCELISSSTDEAIQHLKSDHNFDLFNIKVKFKMDQYSYIKMINYIRSNKTNPVELQAVGKTLWDDEKYLKPVEYEPWLTYDFEGIEVVGCEKFILNEEDKDFQIKNLKEKLAEKDELLSQAFETVEKLRAGLRRIVEKDIDGESKQEGIASLPVRADEGYFTSYAHFSIHYDMLADSVRTSSYRDAILNNRNVIEGKTVLDLGCGTSILSMFASSAGAEKIVAIDNSEIIYKAMDIARINNFKNIHFIKGRLEDTELPIDKVDIVISEWMGYFLIFEGMLDSIIYARDRHLKLGGTIMPNRCNISIVGYGDERRHQEYIQFWDSVYGFDMSTIKKEVLQEPVIEICDSNFVLTESNVIADYNLNVVSMNYSNFSFDFNMKVIKDGNLIAFVGYFDTFFDLPNNVRFSTSPHDKPTHWKQVVFFIEKPITVREGETVQGKIQCRRNIKDMRSLNIKIKLEAKEYNYKME